MEMGMRLGEMLPVGVAAVMEQLRAAGFEAYAVGGCVRDALLGRAPHDWDLTTNATPAQMKSAVTFRALDTGIKHGTVTFLVDDKPIETTTFRTDGAYSDGRHPDSVSFARTIEEDLARRDFTVNAMAWSPETGIVDPFGGASDLQAGVLRCVGDAETRFSEDGLRIMRALRFASTYGLEVEPVTAKAACRKAGMLPNVSAERISAELLKMMAAPDGAHLARVVKAFFPVMFQVFPELAPALGYDQQNPHHDRDLWTHLVDTMAGTAADPTLRLAALLHDIGKPAVRTYGDDGVAHYLGHAEEGAKMAHAALRRLKFPRKVVDGATFLVRQHDSWPSGSAKSARRFLARCGDEDTARTLLALMRADRAAHADIPSHRTVDSLDAFEAQLDAALAEATAFTVKDLAIGGADLLERGWPQGRELGAELARLFDAVIADEVPNERDALLQAMRDPAGGRTR